MGSKIKTDFNLWLGCMRGDMPSWNLMVCYNIQDVALLEKLYIKLLPWIKGHANHSLLNETDKPVCPRCGGTHHHKRGFSYTNASK
ncbi:MAG: hypothetical protein DDT42_02039 [candidate division WS2 bacterium]|uniref:Uncharacterized protein n=1 Tax=Psychracetigena formicireducens TaxID=2986056 RepID=A0A9E2F2U1_PSYF1|nr:hypothetical protein [Candidatus Psychracetigena formicireducens]